MSRTHRMRSDQWIERRVLHRAAREAKRDKDGQIRYKDIVAWEVSPFRSISAICFHDKVYNGRSVRQVYGKVKAEFHSDAHYRKQKGHRDLLAKRNAQKKARARQELARQIRKELGQV